MRRILSLGTRCPAESSLGREAELLIPRVFHRIWLGGREMPAEYVHFGDTWRVHHPRWEVQTWSEDNLPPLRNQAAFDSATSWSQKSDVLRYEILWMHGGVYLDTDMECLRPIDDLLLGVEAFAGSEDGEWISTAILGAAPRHRLFDGLVEGIPVSIAEHPDAAANLQTGPMYFTHFFREHPELERALTIFPPERFYPYHFTEPHRRNERFPEAHAVHHWSGSWLADANLRGVHGERLIVALDTADPSPSLALLATALRRLAPESLAELVVVVPLATAAETASELIEAVRPPAATVPVVIRSAEEAIALPCAAVFAATGDPTADAVGAAEALERLIASCSGSPAPGPASDAIAEQLRCFAERATRPVEAALDMPIRPGDPGRIHGAYLGDGRILISTLWGAKVLASANDLSLTPDLVATGIYDVALTNFLRRRLGAGATAVDVGANIGLFTVLMGELVGPTGRVVAYEPFPHAFTLLEQNVDLNYQRGWVTTRPKAVSSDPGPALLHLTNRFQGNASLKPHDAAYVATYPSEAFDEVEVDAVTLDTELAGFSHVDLVKIDAEGAEHLVLNGLQRLLAAGRIRAVALEAVEPNMGAHWPVLLDLLRGYEQAGWIFAAIELSGELASLSVADIARIGRLSQLVMQRPV